MEGHGGDEIVQYPQMLVSNMPKVINSLLGALSGSLSVSLIVPLSIMPKMILRNF
jgi:hypothetical protein